MSHWIVDLIGTVIGLLKIGGGKVLRSVGDWGRWRCWLEVGAGE